MKRQNILIAACSLAAVSLGGNIWLLMHRNEKPAPTVLEKAPPALPTAAEFDFSDTAFADGSWKLTEESEPTVKAVDLAKPFSWQAIYGKKPAVDLTKPVQEYGESDTGLFYQESEIPFEPPASSFGDNVEIPAPR